jgi:hypothetical protein
LTDCHAETLDPLYRNVIDALEQRPDLKRSKLKRRDRFEPDNFFGY